MSIFTTENEHVIDLIVERWISGSAHLEVRRSLEGVEHDFQRSVITFGCRAGPVTAPYNLLHEMAHFVELPEEKVAKRHWGFSFGTPGISAFGIHTIPTTWEATKREIRVWAWQSILLDEVNLNMPIEEVVSAARHMNDFLLVPGKGDEQKLALVASMTKDFKDGLDIGRFDRIWFDRVAKLPDIFKLERDHRKFMDTVLQGDIRVSWIGTLADAENDYLQIVINERSDGVHSAYEVYGLIGGELCWEGSRSFLTHDEATRYASRLFGGEDVSWSEAPVAARISP